jgi:hypothetical protein
MKSSVVVYKTFDCTKPDEGITQRWRFANSMKDVKDIITEEVQKYDICDVVFQGNIVNLHDLF